MRASERLLPATHSVIAVTDLASYLQDTGNKVSRKSQIIGTQNIILGGKSVIQAEVIIRGDLVRTLDAPAGTEKKAPVVAVAIGRYCFLSRGCVLKPPGRVMKGYVPPLSSGVMKSG